MGDLQRFPDEAECQSDGRWKGRLAAAETVDSIIDSPTRLGLASKACYRTFGGSKKHREALIDSSAACPPERQDSKSSIKML
jgi:hypothetical protein